MQSQWHQINDINTAKEKILSKSSWIDDKNMFLKIKKHISPCASSVLDFGCGIGRNISMLSSFNLQVTGYDLPNMVKLAYAHLKHNPNLHFDWDYVKSFNYDFVWSSLVFQHIPEKALYTYLKDLSNMTTTMVVFTRIHHDFSNKTVTSILQDTGWNTYKLIQTCGQKEIELRHDWLIVKHDMHQDHQSVSYVG